MQLYNLLNKNIHRLWIVIGIYLFCTSNVIAYQNEYILEFSTEQQRNSLLNNHNQFLQVRYQYDSDLFTGAAVNFESEHMARKLLNHPHIIKSWPIQQYSRQHAPMDFRDPQELDDSEPDTVHFVPQDKVCCRNNDKKKLCPTSVISL
jgi:hypothetical protein